MTTQITYLGPIDLGRNPNIRIISLEAHGSLAASLKYLLSDITLPNMERIDLIFTGSSSNLGGWKDVDAILDSERFVALRRVMLYVRHPIFDDRAIVVWPMKLSEQLHSLNSKGILRVQVRHINS
jgi:hypothetical protein